MKVEPDLGYTKVRSDFSNSQTQLALVLCRTKVRSDKLHQNRIRHMTYQSQVRLALY